MDPATSGVFNVTDLSELNYQSLLIEIQKVECLVNSLASLVASEIFNREIPEYVSLKEAARLKGVTSYKNLMKKLQFYCAMYLCITPCVYMSEMQQMHLKIHLFTQCYSVQVLYPLIHFTHSLSFALS